MVTMSERRALLTTRPHPEPRHDLLIDLVARLGERFEMMVRYVPDRLVLDAIGFARYADTLAPVGGLAGNPGPEELAVMVLDDLANELIARWLQVSVEQRPGHEVAISHRVVIEDRQPNWDNPGLIARLRPL